MKTKMWQLAAVILSALALTALLHRPAKAQGAGVHSVVISAPGTVTLVTGIPGVQIRVLSAVLVENNGCSTWKFQSSTGPTDLTGNLFLSSGPNGSPTATGAVEFAPAQHGWFTTAAGDSLLLFQNVAPGSPCSFGAGGVLTYELVQ